MKAKEFITQFNSEYPHISHNLTDKEIEDFLKEHKGLPIKRIMSYFEDYLLSQGLADVQE